MSDGDENCRSSPMQTAAAKPTSYAASDCIAASSAAGPAVEKCVCCTGVWHHPTTRCLVRLTAAPEGTATSIAPLSKPLVVAASSGALVNSTFKLAAERRLCAPTGPASFSSQESCHPAPHHCPNRH